MTSITDSLLHKTTYNIDQNTGLTRKITDANGAETNYTYNTNKQIKDVVKNNKHVSYTYNTHNLLSKIDKDGTEYHFEYDEFLRNKKVKIGNNITLITNQYENNNGNLTSSTYGNNHIISYTYDDFDRIKTITKMNDTYHYYYNNFGKISQIKSISDLVSYQCDLAQRISMYRFNNFHVFYQYDVNSLLKQKRYLFNSLEQINEYTYNLDNALTKIKYNDDEIDYEYDYLGRFTHKKINNQYISEYTYKKNGKRTSLLIDSIKNKDHKYFYQYDNLNNITKIYDNEVLTNQYDYDQDNQLIREDNYFSGETTRYQYDNNGNILKKSFYKVGTDEFLRKDTYQYENTSYQDELTKFNQEDITYDGIGNPLTIGDNVSLTWINGRQLNTYQDLENVISYQYDVDGIRSKKIVNKVETKYYTEENKIIVEQTGNNMLYFLRDSNQNLLGFQYNNALYYYVKNAQDDIIGILDSDYNEVVSYQYDSFGNILNIIDITDNQIGSMNPFRYRSYYYDKETNLYYLNSRYYNPRWGRFLNADGIVGANQDILSYNLYAYCGNNPVNNVDLNGNLAGALVLGGLALTTGLVELSKTILISAVVLAGALLLGYMSYSVTQDIIQKGQTAKPDTKKETEPEKPKEHYVYILHNQQTNVVEYVGRTKNLDQTERRHKNNPARQHLTLIRIAGPVTYEAARGIEQYNILKYKTLNRLNPTNNQIYGIRWDNPKRDIYMDAAYEALGVHETDVRW